MLAPVHAPVNGIFVEKEFGKYFEFSNTPSDWGRTIGATHQVYVLDGLRDAKILKTVAYVAVDEDDNGPVWEKWQIRRTDYLTGV